MGAGGSKDSVGWHKGKNNMETSLQPVDTIISATLGKNRVRGRQLFWVPLPAPGGSSPLPQPQCRFQRQDPEVLRTGLLGSRWSHGFPSPSSQTGGCGLAGSCCYLLLSPDALPRHRHLHTFRRAREPLRLSSSGGSRREKGRAEGFSASPASSKQSSAG